MLRMLNLPEQFRQVLSHAPVARSPHFSLHHAPRLQGSVDARARSASSSTGEAVPQQQMDTGKGLSGDQGPQPGTALQTQPGLSSELASLSDKAVDNPVDEPVHKLTHPAFGFVIPKRLARRAVTRNLIRRQMRCTVADHRLALHSGAWVLRLRAPFDPKVYPSAASEPLRRAVREELRRLMGSLSRPSSSSSTAASSFTRAAT